MATHSSILAWRISWTEAGGLQSIGSQRVRYKWSDLPCMQTVPYKCELTYFLSLIISFTYFNHQGIHFILSIKRFLPSLIFLDLSWVQNSYSFAYLSYCCSFNFLLTQLAFAISLPLFSSSSTLKNGENSCHKLISYSHRGLLKTWNSKLRNKDEYW